MAVLVGCAPTGLRLDEAAEPARVAAEPRPSAPAPRPPTRQGCTFLDPEPTGPSVSEGPAFDLIAASLGLEAGRPRPAWIQPARPPAAITDQPFYVAMAEGRLRWCFVAPEGDPDALACDSSLELPWIPVPSSSADHDPEATRLAAQVAALHDRAWRVLDGPDHARRCTPAPEEVTRRIAPPHWSSTPDGTVLELVEELHPTPELARIVQLRVRPFAGAVEMTRTELYSWDPQEAR
ncbi:MAG: hypothetical protein H6712_32235 [Myxococcales bacterium]|nr:hypothetical protein [Myxococcales bacterium]MCB9718564.1 hypothetical protein [Myxococcales bacterium]